MRPRALLMELERDLTRLRSYSAWCERNGPFAAAAVAAVPPGPTAAATSAITPSEVRKRCTMDVPWETQIRHTNDRCIASQLRLLHGKLRFFAEPPVLPEKTAIPCPRAGGS